MPARKNQGLVNLIAKKNKHMEKDLLLLYNKQCSVEYVWQMFSAYGFFTDMITNTDVNKKNAKIVHIYIE